MNEATVLSSYFIYSLRIVLQSYSVNGSSVLTTSSIGPGGPEQLRGSTLLPAGSGALTLQNLFL